MTLKVSFGTSKKGVINMKECRKKFLDWNVYQIYPRSFMDSNCDGIGDIKGITGKLDYLKELGINAVWLSPCYKSPNCDNGYDISDYRDIMDEFGTLDDWKEMISGMHARGIKLIMDFVGNHTSSEHKWFKEGRKSKDNPYHDYYIWRDKIPNEWKSCFGDPSAWEYNEPTDEYYLHSFAIGQPDLNWDNPKVREEMRGVIDYWVNLGVDGFRCDVLDYIAKDIKHDKMKNGPKLHEYIKELFGRDKVKHIFTVGECSMGPEAINDICGEDRNELTCIFQFEHFVGVTNDKFVAAPYKIDDIRNVLVKWQYFAEKNNLLYTLFTDNHDNSRFISRLGNDKESRYECATMYATMFYLLKGIPFIYQGQEFGTPDPRYDDISFYDDIECINYYHKNKSKVSQDELMDRVNFNSRDNNRRPLCWDNGKNYGFSSGDKTWLPLHSRGAEVNLENDRKADKSVFEFYKKVLELRNSSDTVRYGKFDDLTQGDGYFAYTRTIDGEQILVVCNFDEPREITGLPEGDYLFGNCEKRKPNGKYMRFETGVYISKTTE